MMRDAQVAKVHKAAVAIYGKGPTASSIAAMESAYLDHLAAGGSPDSDTAQQLFGAGREPFWLDAWKQARGRGF